MGQGGWGQEEGSQKRWEQRSRNGRRQLGPRRRRSRDYNEAEEEVKMEGGQMGCGTGLKGSLLKHREEKARGTWRSK